MEPYINVPTGLYLWWFAGNGLRQTTPEMRHHSCPSPGEEITFLPEEIANETGMTV